MTRFDTMHMDTSAAFSSHEDCQKDTRITFFIPGKPKSRLWLLIKTVISIFPKNNAYVWHNLYGLFGKSYGQSSGEETESKWRLLVRFSGIWKSLQGGCRIWTGHRQISIKTKCTLTSPLECYFILVENWRTKVVLKRWKKIHYLVIYHQNCKPFAGSRASNMNVFCFFMFYIQIHSLSLNFRQLLTQKRSKDATSVSGKPWWALTSYTLI